MANKVFYTAKEAQARLGIDPNRFNYLVRNGRIKRVILPGKKVGVYPVSEVDKLATLVDTAINLYDPSKVHFEVAEEADLPDVVQIGMTVFGGITTPLETQREWLKRCPEAIHVLKTASDEVVGHIIMLPMPEQRAIEIVSRKIIVGNLPLDEIEDFQPGKPIHAYVRQIATIPTTNEDARSQWGMTLVAGMASFIENLGARKIQLGNIYALATTKDGRRICQVLGFDRLSIIPDPTKPNEIAYRLNVQESGIVFARRYREEYEAALQDTAKRVRPEPLERREPTKKQQAKTAI